MFVVGVKSEYFFLDVKMIQEFVGDACIFGKNEGRFLQNAQGPKRDIF